MITGFVDEFPETVGKRRSLFVGCMLLLSFLISLPTTAPGGIYFVTLLENHGAGIGLMMIAFLEAIAVTWFYGEFITLLSLRIIYSCI